MPVYGKKMRRGVYAPKKKGAASSIVKQEKKIVKEQIKSRKAIVRAIDSGSGSIISNIPFPRNVSRRDPFKERMYVTLRYSELWSPVIGTAGVIGTERVWSLNDLYDPRFSTGGHQPMYRDTLATLYANYIVDAVTIDIKYTDVAGDNSVLVSQVQPSDSSTAITGAACDALLEVPRTSMVMMNASGEQTRALRQRIRLHELEGVSRSQWKSGLSTYGAAVGSSPTSKPYLRVALGSFATNTAGNTCTSIVTIDYHCQFYKRIQQSQS